MSTGSCPWNQGPNSWNCWLLPQVQGALEGRRLGDNREQRSKPTSALDNLLLLLFRQGFLEQKVIGSKKKKKKASCLLLALTMAPLPPTASCLSGSHFTACSRTKGFRPQILQCGLVVAFRDPWNYSQASVSENPTSWGGYIPAVSKQTSSAQPHIVSHKVTSTLSAARYWPRHGPLGVLCITEATTAMAREQEMHLGAQPQENLPHHSRSTRPWCQGLYLHLTGLVST
jgi:hypothetical protein